MWKSENFSLIRILYHPDIWSVWRETTSQLCNSSGRYMQLRQTSDNLEAPKQYITLSVIRCHYLWIIAMPTEVEYQLCIESIQNMARNWCCGRNSLYSQEYYRRTLYTSWYRTQLVKYLVKERNYIFITACVRRVNSIVDDVPGELLSKVYTLKYRGHSTCEVTGRQYVFLVSFFTSFHLCSAFWWLDLRICCATQNLEQWAFVYCHG